MANLRVTKKYPNGNGWEERHNEAVLRAFQPYPWTDTQENAVVMLMHAWANYANAHKERFESVIGDDGFLGPLWEDMGKSLRGMLNGELGRLDGGTCDAFILDTLSENGVDTSLL